MRRCSQLSDRAVARLHLIKRVHLRVRQSVLMYCFDSAYFGQCIGTRRAEMKRHLSRRNFLKGTLAAGSVGLLAACIAPPAGSSGRSEQGAAAEQPTVVVESRT